MTTDDRVVLPDGSTIDADRFEDLEERLAAEDAEDFQQNRFSTRRQADDVTPFTSRPTVTVEDVGGRRHEERSKRARSTDEAYNAPVAPDYRTWAENKNRYDLPGVDTIPEDELARRGKGFLGRAEEAGAVESVERKSLRGSTKGQFRARANKKDLGGGATLTGGTAGYETKVQADEDLDDPNYPSFGEGPVLAHETGHATDFEAGGKGSDFLSKKGFFSGNDADLRGEARDLSERVRGGIIDRQRQYREKNEELMADAMAAMAIEPRAARREAPNLVAKIEEEVDERIDEPMFDV